MPEVTTLFAEHCARECPEGCGKGLNRYEAKRGWVHVLAPWPDYCKVQLSEAQWLEGRVLELIRILKKSAEALSDVAAIDDPILFAESRSQPGEFTSWVVAKALEMSRAAIRSVEGGKE